MAQRKLIHRGKIIQLYLEEVEFPNHTRTQLEIVRHPGGAAAVALTPENKVCLLRQYRHPAAGWLWELPAGKRDGGEPPLQTVQRELEEEAGLRARHWQPLGAVYASPGIFDEVVHLFLARELTPVDTHQEKHELIEIHWLPLEEALTLAYDGDIQDAKTLVGLFRAQRRLQSP